MRELGFFGAQRNEGPVIGAAPQRRWDGMGA
jgi:hypothetical protein